MSEPAIYAALAAVMDDCKAVAKRDLNQHQRFHFRGIDAVVNAVGPVLRKHGVIVAPNVEHVTYDVVSTSTGKPATACRVLVTYTFYASDGSSIDTRVAAEAWDAGDKAAPKAMSVAFRTALLQSLALPTDEPDPDSQTYERDHGPRPHQQAATRGDFGEQITDAQVRKLNILLREHGMDTDEARYAWLSQGCRREITSSKQLTKAEATRAIDALDRKATSRAVEPSASEADLLDTEGDDA